MMKVVPSVAERAGSLAHGMVVTWAVATVAWSVVVMVDGKAGR